MGLKEYSYIYKRFEELPHLQWVSLLFVFIFPGFLSEEQFQAKGLAFILSLLYSNAHCYDWSRQGKHVGPGYKTECEGGTLGVPVY